MASASDIAEVRRNTAEPNDDNGYTDSLIGAYVDLSGVAGASAKIWEEKAAARSDEIDVSEAGASHKFSGLHKNALEQAEYWRSVESAAVPEEGPIIQTIVRE